MPAYAGGPRHKQAQEAADKEVNPHSCTGAPIASDLAAFPSSALQR